MSGQRIETERLVLRRFAGADWETLARFYGDDTVMRHMLPGRGLPRAEAAERAKSNIHNFNDHWERRGYGVWAVEDRASGRLLGQCGLRWIAEAEQTELLYLFSKTVWGRGLATEAGRAALQYAFEAHGLDKLIALTAPGNKASQRVLGKLGFRYDGEAPLWERIVSWFALPREAWQADPPIISAK
ncbi:GNAT family N-acetyltransferase [Ferrovibrio sp.]|jgi:RimJ/RimL family protein N-acetyltransferase|uniref:GNAT family N-acetyltransferase n=1 Tax=Ferrovibrio sp. TaxID=1917215 RepID=UPI0035AF3676